MTHDIYLSNVPSNAEVDIVAAQLELADVLDKFIDLSPVDEDTASNSLIRPALRSLSVLGSGLLRSSTQGYIQGWTRFGATRTEEVRQLFGRDLGPPKITYSAAWSNDVTNSGYHPSNFERMTFEVGVHQDEDIEAYNMMTKFADNALREAANIPPEPSALTIDMVMEGLEKPDGVRDELWDYGRNTAYNALYFMQRVSSPSTRGARFIVNQHYVPQTPDQIADIAIYNTLKFIDLQHGREQVILSRMGSA